MFHTLISDPYPHLAMELENHRLYDFPVLPLTYVQHRMVKLPAHIYTASEWPSQTRELPVHIFCTFFKMR